MVRGENILVIPLSASCVWISSCRVPPPSPSSSVLPSLDRQQLPRPSKYWQREAHGAQRGLGDVLADTRDATINARASFTRTGHFQADLESLKTFDSETTFSAFSVIFALVSCCFTIFHRGSKRVIILTSSLEGQRRCKPLGEEGNSIEQIFFYRLQTERMIPPASTVQDESGGNEDERDQNETPKSPTATASQQESKVGPSRCCCCCFLLLFFTALSVQLWTRPGVGLN